MKHHNAVLMLLTIAIIVSHGCAGRGEKDVLARIDKKHVIRLDEFEGRIEKLPERYRDIINKNKKEFLDEVIVDVLLYNEALRKGLEKDKDVKAVMKEAYKKIVIARLLKDEVEDKITVGQNDIEDYYNANKTEFTTQELRRASHILVRTEKEARDILVELSNGRNFEDLARARSIDPTSSVGGDIGYFTRRQLVPEIDEASFNMETGEISDIIKTKFGYHILKITETKEPHIKELGEVSDAIEESLKRVKKKMVFNDFVNGLKEKAQITINDDLLDTISESKNPDK
ncbi:MAG: peptidyl-prolyl cis-trans isomerase [Candidatus Omnitrophota bacterium]